MADEIVLSFHDSLLRESDLSLLEEGRWLNDRLIGFVFDYFTHDQFKQISNKVVFISPDVTQFLKLGEAIEIGIFLEPLNLPNQKLVFFAVNDNDSKRSAGGSHWSLLMYNRQTNSFHHYDSCSAYNTPAARSLARNVQPFLHGYDCGIYVIYLAEELCKNYLANKETSLSDTVTAENIRQKRKALKKLILDLGETKT